MLKTRIFKALVIGLLSLAVFGEPASASEPRTSCPAFTAAMIDATALVMELREDVALAGKPSADPAASTPMHGALRMKHAGAPG